MAWRIHQSVLRGEIDNRQRGRVRSSIWLVGRNKPVTLDLSGNCLRDLAGCLVRFQNPRATLADDERTDLDHLQNGLAGEITASRKVRVFDVPIEEALRLTRDGKTPPEHFANGCYIEWFSKANGRVVIESTNYSVDVSAPEWILSPDEEQEQIAASHEALLAWLDQLDQPDESNDSAKAGEWEEDRPLDEFGYEKLMRESDTRTDKVVELFEKYRDHPQCAKMVAREMGWEWLEEAVEADERGSLPPREKLDKIPTLKPNPATEGIDWVRDEDGHVHHPLTERALDLSVDFWKYCEERGLMGDKADPDLVEMISQFQIAGAKIGGALDGLAYDEDPRESGFIVAALKRVLNYLHASLAACEKVANKKLLDPERLESFHTELFDFRERVLALMQRFRSSPFR
jgi:hypothetical protein